MNNTTVQREGLCSQMASTLFTVLLSIISLGALIGNSLVIVTFYKTRSLRTSTNYYYLVNMAVSDLICACFNWPLYATEGMLTGSEFITEPFASVVCKLGLYFRGISQIVSVLSLVLISVNRYAAIALPLKTTMLCRRKVRLILLFSWILPVVCGLPYLFYTRVVKLNGPVFCRTVWSKSLNAIYIGVGFVIFYCGPLLAIIIFYTLTIKTLRKRPVSLEENLPSKIYDKRKKQNEKVIKFVIIIVAGFFICWTPLIVYLALKMFHPELFPKDVCLIFVGALFYVLPSLSTAINPVILLLLSSNYRRALNDLILCKVLKGRLSYLSRRRTRSSKNNTISYESRL